MRRLLGILATVITIGVGLVVLLDLTGVLALIVPTLGSGLIAAAFLRLTLVTLALMIVAGLFNLVIAHGERIRRLERGWVYSAVLLISAAAVITLWLAGREDANQLLLNNVQVAVESSLAALVLFALVYAAYRMLHRRPSWWGALFVLTLIVVLLGALPLGETSALQPMREWLLSVPVSAGARGILLGIALGTVVTGLRVLLGQERSYRE
jgi:hypothetical protein